MNCWSAPKVRIVSADPPDDSSVCIANGVDVERFANAAAVRVSDEPGCVVIGFIGSMKAWHGVDDLL